VVSAGISSCALAIRGGAVLCITWRSAGATSEYLDPHGRAGFLEAQPCQLLPSIKAPHELAARGTRDDREAQGRTRDAHAPGAAAEMGPPRRIVPPRLRRRVLPTGSLRRPGARGRAARSGGLTGARPRGPAWDFPAAPHVGSDLRLRIRPQPRRSG